MSLRVLVALVCLAELATLISAGGHGGGGHKKVVIHVPLHVKHHHHTHTIVKHVHHKSGGGGGGDDHYEVLGYTYGEPKAAPHFGGGGHGWGAADEGHESLDSPVSYGLSGSDDYGSEGHGY